MVVLEKKQDENEKNSVAKINGENLLVVVNRSYIYEVRETPSFQGGVSLTAIGIDDLVDYGEFLWMPKTVLPSNRLIVV